MQSPKKQSPKKQLSWKQFVYGKLVQEIEGPIVRGKDHECTGLSQGIPRSVQLKMSPSVVGPGTSDLTTWNEYDLLYLLHLSC